MNQLRRKLWIGIGAFVLGGTRVDLKGVMAAPKGEGVEGGEGGEGGERGERARKAGQSKIAWLTGLGLVEGHLLVAMELLRAGALDAAKTHVKHPSDEIYASLKPGFRRYRAEGFAAELEKLAKAANAADTAAAENAYREVTKKIERARGKAPASTKELLLVTARLVETAGEEYRESIKDGRVADAHEYQDAFGFTRVAGNLLERAQAKSISERSAVESARKAIADLNRLWPSLPGDGATAGDPARLHAAGSQIELGASGLR